MIYNLMPSAYCGQIENEVTTIAATGLASVKTEKTYPADMGVLLPGAIL